MTAVSHAAPLGPELTDAFVVLLRERDRTVGTRSGDERSDRSDGKQGHGGLTDGRSDAA